MSHYGNFINKASNIPVAGISSYIEGITCEQNLRPDLYYKPPSTPENIRKHRKSLREKPGKKQLHPGIYEDAREYEQMVHGVKTLKSEHVKDCINSSNFDGIKYFMNNIQEQKYKRTQREPLGKSLVRNYEFPEKFKKDTFAFGVPTTGGIN